MQIIFSGRVVLKNLTLSLPWPPSVNRYWRSIGRGRVIISKEGRTYRKTILDMLADNKITFGKDRIVVLIEAYPPDRRRRDLDNLKKAMFDALGAAGVYHDDCQIDSDLTSRMTPVKDGRITIALYNYTDLISIRHKLPLSRQLNPEKANAAPDELKTFIVNTTETLANCLAVAG